MAIDNFGKTVQPHGVRGGHPKIWEVAGGMWPRALGKIRRPHLEIILDIHAAPGRPVRNPDGTREQDHLPGTINGPALPNDLPRNLALEAWQMNEARSQDENRDAGPRHRDWICLAIVDPVANGRCGHRNWCRWNVCRRCYNLGGVKPVRSDNRDPRGDTRAYSWVFRCLFKEFPAAGAGV